MQKKKIKIIEDCAHAFPTIYKNKNKYVGNSNNLCCFSFYANKTITTGEGGMITTNNSKIANRLKILRQHGMSRNVWNRYTNKSNKWEYDIIELGYKYNLPDINSSIGIEQLKKSDLMRKKREYVAKKYYAFLKDCENIILPKINSSELKNNSWHIFSITLKNENIKFRNDLIEKLNKIGISTSVHYKPLHLMTYYKKKIKMDKKYFPNSNRLWKTTISLPIYDKLKLADIKNITKNIIKFTTNV